MRVVLASSSPRRVEILKGMNIEFDVVPANIDESPLSEESPIDYVARLAREKALAVAESAEADLVVGADTTIDMNGQIFGQPKDADDARQTLVRLSGKSHFVHTGVCVVSTLTGIAITEVETSTVTFKVLSESEIDAYLATDEWRGKAGGYAIQGQGGNLIAGLEGSRSNVIGLPEGLTRTMLVALGAK